MFPKREYERRIASICLAELQPAPAVQAQRFWPGSRLRAVGNAGKPEGRDKEFWRLAEQQLFNLDKGSPLRTLTRCDELQLPQR
ncbi:DUF2934 domain-containing protein [Bradyrhizobium tropiciagri]|nr:DUF2934 domain-containing protein [Bradyrhizobium tropiciagri]